MATDNFWDQKTWYEQAYKLLKYSKEENKIIYKNAQPIWARCKREIKESVNKDGYIIISFKTDFGKVFKAPAHRINFYLHNRFLPEIVDHINGDRKNYHIDNLRPCTKLENNKNSKRKKRELPRNVYKVKDGYLVSIVSNYVRYEQKFTNLEDAEKAANIKRNELHGEFSTTRNH